jgi:hypothetical protein
VEVADRTWYVDTWSVLDGRLFASVRPPESIEASSTVFLAVPDLEPVPVGRISTALHACRAGFQEGLRGEDGAEIPFRSLDEVRALVRRGYLGGGLGPGAPGVPAEPIPAPDAGAGGAYLGERLQQLEATRLWVDREVDLRVALREVDCEHLGRLVEPLAAASIAAWSAGLLEAGLSHEQRGLVAWISTLVGAGAFGDLAHHAEARVFDVLHHVHVLHHVRAEDAFWDMRSTWLQMRAPSHAAQIMLAPTPRAPLWDQRLTRVQEHLLLAAARPTSLREFPTYGNLAATLLAVMVVGANGEHLVSGSPTAVEAARDRLIAEVDETKLPDAAERALSVFVEDRLNGHVPPEPDFDEEAWFATDRTERLEQLRDDAVRLRFE